MKNPILPPLSPPSPDALAPDYYLTNLQRLLTHVAGLYDDLLTDAEHAWLADFQALPADGQKLYTRLLMRKGPLFRQDRLDYPEIGAIGAAAEHLHAHAWLTINATDSPEVLLKLFTRAELGRWLPLPVGIKPKLRAEQDEAILTHYSAEQIHTRIQQHTQWYSLLRTEPVPIFQFLFFGNAHQDLAEFVMSDLGIVRYEAYPLARNQRFFLHRERLDKLMTLTRIKSQFWDNTSTLSCAEILQLVAELPEPGVDAYLQRKTEQTRNLLARQLERLGDTGTALTLYQLNTTPPARERTARLQAKAGQTAQALALCQTMLANPMDPDEVEFAEQFAARLQGQRKPRKTQQDLGEEDWLWMPRPDSDNIYVEELAAAHYRQQGWHALHLENTLFNGLLGLLLWDIIFAPVPDAFFNPFQRGPRDLFRPEFRHTRAALIEPRLAELDTSAWQQRVLATAQAKRDIANNLVNWSALDEPLLQQITQVIPGQHLRVVVDRILDHPGFYRNGFPDLLLMHPDGDYRLAEVKGPGDTLQSNQIRWLRFFHAHQIPAQVTWLRWQDARHGE